MEKIMCMQVAATLANAVISNVEDNLTVDVDINDPDTRAENLMTWEVFRIFYHAVKKAAEDEESWPSPVVDYKKELKFNLNPLIAQIAPLIIPFLENPSQWVDILKEFLQGMGGGEEKTPPPEELPV